MAKKNERELKVCAMSGYNYKSVPAIRLMGQWLEAAGFHIGDPVLVKCEDGKLIISLDTARAEQMEAEKAFMEKETRKLHLLPPVNFAEASVRWRYSISLLLRPFIGILLFV